MSMGMIGGTPPETILSELPCMGPLDPPPSVMGAAGSSQPPRGVPAPSAPKSFSGMAAPLSQVAITAAANVLDILQDHKYM